MKMIKAVFIFGVVIPAVVTAVLFTVFIVYYFCRARLKEKLSSKCPMFKTRSRESNDNSMTSLARSLPPPPRASSAGSSSRKSNGENGVHNVTNLSYEPDEVNATAIKSTVSMETDVASQAKLSQPSQTSSLRQQGHLLRYKPPEAEYNRMSSRDTASAISSLRAQPSGHSQLLSSKSSQSAVFHTASSLQFDPVMTNMSFGSLQQQSVYSFQSAQSGVNQNNNGSQMVHQYPHRDKHGQWQVATCRCQNNDKSIIAGSPDRRTLEQKPGSIRADPSGGHISRCRKFSENARSDDSGYSNSGSDCDYYGNSANTPAVHKTAQTFFNHDRQYIPPMGQTQIPTGTQSMTEQRSYRANLQSSQEDSMTIPKQVYISSPSCCSKPTVGQMKKSAIVQV